MENGQKIIRGLLVISSVLLVYGYSQAQGDSGWGVRQWLKERADVVETWSKEAAKSALDTIASYVPTGAALSKESINAAVNRLDALKQHAQDLVDEAIAINASVAEKIGASPFKTAAVVAGTAGRLALPSAIALGAATGAAYIASDSASKFIDEAIGKLKSGARVTAAEVNAIEDQATKGLKIAQASTSHAESLATGEHEVTNA